MIERMFFDFKRFDYSRVGRYKINQRLGLDVANTTENRVFQMSDLVAIIREIIRLNNSQEPADDIDALSNRRVKLVGELVVRQFYWAIPTTSTFGPVRSSSRREIGRASCRERV